MEKKIWKNRSICPSPLILQEKSIMEIMATSKNYGKKKGSDHFRDILNPYGEKPNYGKIGRRRRLSKLNVFFFHNSVGDHILLLFCRCLLSFYGRGNVQKHLKRTHRRLDGDMGIHVFRIQTKHTGTMWGPRSIAKLVYNSYFTMVYGTYNYSCWGESKPTYNWGGHIVVIWVCLKIVYPKKTIRDLSWFRFFFPYWDVLFWDI